MSPETYRLSFHEARDALAKRLAEPAPGRIQLLAGPRQVGKTTMLLYLAKQHGKAAIYAAADSPEAALPGFWERLWIRAEETVASEGRALVLLDEAHLLHDWASHLKGEWDRLRRRKLPVHVVATGSSALKLAHGSRESLAGRFERITLTHWSATSLAEVFGVPPAEACEHLVKMGSYPGAFELRRDLTRWSAYVRDAILEPAVGRDILALAAVRKPALLRQVFGIAASSPTQIMSLQKIQGQLQDPGALETIAHYLSLLEEAFLVAPLPKHATRPARQRAAPPKLVPLNNAIMAVSDPRGIPDRTRDPDRWGVWVENACLGYAWNAGQRVSYWREEPLEVDGVLEGSWGAWAIEVKTGKISAVDLRGLGEFVRRHSKFRPLVVCDQEARLVAERAGFEATPWTDFLLHGPPRATADAS
jgi:predicted AAA+ superfamily ATPase